MEAVMKSTGGASPTGMDDDDFEDESLSIEDADFEVEEPDIDDELEEIAGRDETLAMGLDDRLKSSFESTTVGTGDAETASMGDTYGPLEEYDIPVQHDLANKLLRRVYRELNEAPTSDIPNRVVLGAPQFAILEPWAHAEHGHGIEAELPVDEVLVVPGPMVDTGLNADELLVEYIERKQDKEDDSDE